MFFYFEHITLTPYNNVFAYLRICVFYTYFRKKKFSIYRTSYFQKFTMKFGIYLIYLNKNLGGEKSISLTNLNKNNENRIQVFKLLKE